MIDAERYRGKIEVRRPFFGEPRLMIAGRDQTKLMDTLRIEDFPLFYPRKLSKRLNTPGAIGAEFRQEVAELLASAFPRA